jgi:heptosyltransferase-2
MQFFMIQPQAPSYQRILVTKGEGIGNVVNMTPTIRLLRSAFPSARIEFLCSSVNAEILRGWDAIDRIIAFPEEVDVLKNTEYDLVVEGVYTDPQYRQYFTARRIITAAPNDMRMKHEISVNAGILSQIDIDVSKIPHTEITKDLPEVKLPPDPGSFTGYIGVCPGCGTKRLSHKNWGADNFASLVRRLLDEYPGKSIVVLGRGESDLELSKLLADKDFVKSGRVVDLVGKISITESASVLKKLDFLVSNDTGLAHIASALDVTNIVFFGPTSIVKNLPQNKCVPITKDMECSKSCQFDRPDCDNRECMRISVDEALGVIREKRPLHGPIKYDFGCWITTYNRYNLLAATLQGVLACHGIKGMKFVISDDASDDPKVRRIIERFACAIEARGNKVVILWHERNRGKYKYDETLNEIVSEMLDCRHMIVLGADYALNPWIFSAAKACAARLNDKVRGILLWKDNRHTRESAYTDGTKMFMRTLRFDWNPGVYHHSFFSKWKITGTPGVGGSGTAQCVVDLASRTGGEIWRYQESLAEHLGNTVSAMNPEVRQEHQIWSVDPNLFELPEILKSSPTQEGINV